MIYMDNAATTALYDEVTEAMLPYFSKDYGNPSSLHSYGVKAAKTVSHARRTMARAINAKEKEIYFTSGGSEADNWALEIAAAAHPRGHIITSKIEHHAIMYKCNELEKRGYSVTYVDVDEYGFVKINDIIDAIRPDTFLITIMTANNEIGTIEPIEKIGKIAREYNILFHTDAVQAFTKMPINVRALGIDMLSACSHKIHGPKGIGLLYVNEHVKMKAMIYGGGQEMGARAGTENVPGIVGFEKAVLINRTRYASLIRRQIMLRDYMIDRLMSEIEDVRLNGHRRMRLCSNINVSFENIEGASLVILLDMKGIAVSSGSACNQGSGKPSYVLKAIGLDDDVAFSSVRFSISGETTKEEIDAAVDAVKDIVEGLRKS